MRNMREENSCRLLVSLRVQFRFFLIFSDQ
jgi:hypothetical protein